MARPTRKVAQLASLGDSALPQQIPVPPHLAEEIDRLAVIFQERKASFDRERAMLSKTIAHYRNISVPTLVELYEHIPAQSLLRLKEASPDLAFPETIEVPDFLNEPVISTAKAGQEAENEFNRAMDLMQKTISHFNGISVEKLQSEYTFESLATGYFLKSATS